jgi:hypothetical protein
MWKAALKSSFLGTSRLWFFDKLFAYAQIRYGKFRTFVENAAPRLESGVTTNHFQTGGLR